jgi:1,4-dihydroxy-2-naphthoate octaprenyltransferase
VSSFTQWFYATRPKTLVASVFPVFIGGSLAFSNCNKLDTELLFLCLLFSFLIQIGTNFANDYYDFIKGADRNRSIAPKRYASSGDLHPKNIRNASYAVLLLSFLIGLLILFNSKGSLHLIWVGCACIASAIFYTGGPRPIAYNGLGDVFVVFFYGFVAVEVTHYVLLCKENIAWSPSFAVSLGMGFAVNSILVVNNYRDFEEDRANGKRTTMVIFGKRFGVMFYCLCIGISTLLCPFYDSRISPVLILLPLGLLCGIKLKNLSTKSDFEKMLRWNVIFVSLYGLLACLGLFWARPVP